MSENTEELKGALTLRVEGVSDQIDDILLAIDGEFDSRDRRAFSNMRFRLKQIGKEIAAATNEDLAELATEVDSILNGSFETLKMHPNVVQSSQEIFKIFHDSLNHVRDASTSILEFIEKLGDESAVPIGDSLLKELLNEETKFFGDCAKQVKEAFKNYADPAVLVEAQKTMQGQMSMYVFKRRELIKQAVEAVS